MRNIAACVVLETRLAENSWSAVCGLTWAPLGGLSRDKVAGNGSGDNSPCLPRIAELDLLRANTNLDLGRWAPPFWLLDYQFNTWRHRT